MKRNVSNRVVDKKMRDFLSKDPPPITSFFTLQSQPVHKDLVIVKRSADQKSIVKVQIPSLKGKENLEQNTEKFQEMNESLLTGIDYLFSGKLNDINFSKLHKYVENYCVLKKSKQLYDTIIMPKLNEITDNFIEMLSVENQDIFELASIIDSFEFSLQNLRKIFQYFERSYIYANRIDGFSKISDIAYNLCRKKFLNQSSVENDALSLIIFQIKVQINIFRCTQTDEFEDHTKDETKQALKTVLSFLDQIDLYGSHVSPQLIEQTTEFYSTVGNEMPFNEFLGWLSLSKENEIELMEAGIKESTIDSFLTSINQAALIDNQDYLFGQEFHDAVNYGENEVIQELFSFFDTDKLREIFTHHLGQHFWSLCDDISNNKISTPSEKVGRKLNEKQNMFETDKNAPVIVQYIDIYNRAMEYLNDLDMQSISSSIRKSFEDYFGQKAEKIAKLLADYFNKGNPISPEEIHFFELLRAKEIFVDSYFILLTKRVLGWKHQIDVDRERELIKEIKKVTGQNMVEQLQLLVNDIETSQNALRDPMKVSISDSPIPATFRAVSLKWDLLNREIFDDGVVYPHPIDKCMEQFCDNFVHVKNSANSTPQLHWSSELSTVEAIIGSTKCKMTATQALILFALKENESNPMSLQELIDIIKVNESTLSDNLLVLSKKESGFIVQKTSDDMYLMNPDSYFTSEVEEAVNFRKNKKIRFPSIESLAAHKEKEAIQNYAETAKRNRILSSIIMKMKVFKVLSIKELFNKVKADIGYEPDIKEFEDVVSYLITKQYLEKTNKQLRYLTAQ